MFVIAIAIEYGGLDFAEGRWSANGEDIDAGEAFAVFPPSAIVLLAAAVIMLGITVWAIVWLARQSESGENRFGPDPRT